MTPQYFSASEKIFSRAWIGAVPLVQPQFLDHNKHRVVAARIRLDGTLPFTVFTKVSEFLFLHNLG